MNPDLEKLDQLLAELQPFNATLVAVSKTKPSEAIDLVYSHGHRHFGENYVQELVGKHAVLPPDILWHFIGHLQSNKVKLIAPFVSLIHGVDSRQLAVEVSKQAVKFERNIDLLLQVHIATEETKFGLSAEEAVQLGEVLINTPLLGITVRGLMGMASFSEDEALIRSEFKSLKRTFDSILKNINPNNRFDTLSMGMSSDYKIALSEGSTMVRIGSAIFGGRS
jgi:PLP dependent protein